jgi:uncharacterized protein (DUF885 family)
MYVCVYVRTYVRMYVRMYPVRTYARLDLGMHVPAVHCARLDPAACMQMTADAAAALLRSELGMSAAEADAEVDAALAAPVQHASYVIGKLEVLR